MSKEPGAIHLPKLETGVNDASAVADLLRQKYGFEVTLLLNPGRSEVIRAMDKLRGELTERDNLLIYYAGHGVLDVEADIGFWMSVDAEEGTQADWISIGTITGTVKVMSAKHVMIVSDSCYSGRLTRGLSVSVKTGAEREAELRRLAAKRSRTALVSGGLEPVSDGGGGGHSVFTRAFLTALRESTQVLDGQQLFTAVRRPVIVNADQTPEYSDIRLAGHDGGDFLFVLVNLGDAAAASSTASGEVIRESLDLAYWESIRESRNAADFEAYLSQFPNVTFAALARNRLGDLVGTDSGALVVPPAAEFELETLDEDFVAVKNANVRAAPSADSQTLATLPAGTTVTVTGRVRGAEWLRVALPDGGVGYVWDRLLGPQEAEAALASAPAAEPEIEPAPEREPALTVWEIVLESGITLGDWVLLAEERLEGEEYVALVVEADRYRRQHGAFAEVDEVLHASILGDVRARSGMARVERAAAYGEWFGAVAGLAQELDAAVAAVLSEVRVPRRRHGALSAGATVEPGTRRPRDGHATGAGGEGASRSGGLRRGGGGLQAVATRGTARSSGPQEDGVGPLSGAETRAVWAAAGRGLQGVRHLPRDGGDPARRVRHGLARERGRTQQQRRPAARGANRAALRAGQV